MYRYRFKKDNLGSRKPWVNKNDPYESDDPDCICQRKSQIFYCEKCFKYFKGRLAKNCPSHRDVTFLMDARVCPYCKAPMSFMKPYTEKELNLGKGKLCVGGMFTE